MNIQTNSVDSVDIKTSASLVNKLGAQKQPMGPKLSELWAHGDKIELLNKDEVRESYVQRLVEMPEIRESKVEYARGLVNDPDYPTSEQLDKTAEILAELL